MNQPLGISQSIDSKVLARIYGGRGGKGGMGTPGGRTGRVFTSSQFLDLGSRAAVDKALARAAKAGRIRRLARGLYDDPRSDASGAPLMPTTDAVIQALVGRDATRVQPSGAHAANLLGLSDQVPVRLVFLTDGHSRTISLGKRKIVMRHVPPRQMAMAGRKSGTIIQALRWLGRKRIGDDVLKKLRRQLGPGDRRDLLKAVRYAPGWIGDILRRLALEEAS